MKCECIIAGEYEALGVISSWGNKALLLYFLFQVSELRKWVLSRQVNVRKTQMLIRHMTHHREKMKQELDRNWKEFPLFFFLVSHWRILLNISTKSLRKVCCSYELTSVYDSWNPGKKVGLFIEWHSWGQVCRGGEAGQGTKGFSPTSGNHWVCAEPVTSWHTEPP